MSKDFESMFKIGNLRIIVEKQRVGDEKMSILSFILALAVIAVMVYGVKLAFAGNWRELVYLAIGLVVAIVILGMLGITLPDIPMVK